MAVDTYKNMVGGLESPARNADTISPDDATDIAFTTRSLYIGGSGDVAVRMAGETSTVIFRSVPTGVLPVRVDRVLTTGTTATDIVALW